MAKAIEIATLLGDSVVDVTYRTEPARASRARAVLAGVALGCLVGSAAAFGISLATAADNQAAFDAWTTARRPAYAFRPVHSSKLLDVLAFGGLAVGVCAFTGMLLCRRRDEHDTVLADESLSFAELTALTGTIERGPTTYVIRSVDAPASEPLQPRASVRPLVYAAGSLVVHLGLLWVMSRDPIEGDPESLDFVSVDPVALYTDTTDLPPEHTSHGERDYEERSPVVLLEFPTRSRHPDGQLRIPRPPAMDPHEARAQAIEQARSAGVLGSGMLRPNFLASLHSDTMVHAFEGQDVTCAAFGVCTDSEGSFGFGRSGFGICGGIDHGGFGTVSTGRYGTIGHGRSGGAGYTPREHASHVPTTRLGHPVMAGDYDKAIIRRYIKRNLMKITYCYERQLLAKPGLAGSISVQFLIASDGTVQTATATGVDEAVTSCIADVVRAIEFPRPRGGGPVQVNYPLTVRPAGQ